MSLLEIAYLWCVADNWSLGFIEGTPDAIINGNSYKVNYVKGIPKDRWYADPFILDYDDKVIELLVEEWRFKNHKGRIAKVTIDRNTYSFINENILLELDTHLSFPFIKRANDEIYVCPENSESGAWKMYKYDRENESLKYVKTIIEAPLTDAISTNMFGDEIVFTTCLPTASGKILNIYGGGITKDFKFNSKEARGAGDLFKVDGVIYRPAQDCNGGYGKAVIIQRVSRQEDGTFSFKDVCKIKSTHPNFKRGCHTFNSYKGLIVIDVFGYRRGILGKATDRLKDIIKKLKH